MKTKFIRLITFLFLCNFAMPVMAQDDEAKITALQKEMTAFIKATESVSISDFQLSPDKKLMAFTTSEPLEDGKSKRNIWIYDLSSKTLNRFTTSIKSDSRPRWSPDGKQIAFLSNRDDKNQIYLINMNGGEALALTESKTSIQSFDWSPDGSFIAFMSSEPETALEAKKKKDKDDAESEDYDSKNSLLRMINVKTKEITNLSTLDWNISEYSWIPGQQKFIVSATQSIFPEFFKNRVYQLDITTKEMKEIANPTPFFSDLTISPDGKNIAFTSSRIDGPQGMDLYLMDIEGKTIKNLTSKSIDRAIVSFSWQDNQNILALAETGFSNTFFNISLKGKAKKMNTLDINPSGAYVFDSKTLIFIAQTITTAPEIYLSSDFKTAKKITDFNKHWDTLNFIKPEIITYITFDQTKIEASLYKPVNYEKGKTYPTVINVHGGPTGRFSERFNSWAQLLADKGYIVLCPNIRGSTGYGYDFMSSNRRDWGGGDFVDVMAGVDYLVETGLSDPDKLGIGGWSYGGYMSAWAVTQTDRFKASVSGAPMTDIALEYGAETSSINAYDTWYMGTPYENLDDFIRMSPVTFVKNVKTPTLLLCGENDITDPIEQCSQFYRGLKRYGVETRFIKYPREGHGIREEKHRIDVLVRMVGWFERFLKD